MKRIKNNNNLCVFNNITVSYKLLQKVGICNGVVFHNQEINSEKIIKIF